MPYFATEDNCRLYYEVRGQGQPVVFIHGWSVNRHFFKKQIPAFAKTYQVVSYDLRGHGDSDRPETGLYLSRFAKDLHELLDYLAVKKVIIVAWSMGVQIVWDYISQYGCDNIAKLVLIDMTPKVVADAEDHWEYTMYPAYTRKAGLAFLNDIAVDWYAVAEKFAPAIFFRGPAQEEIPWVLDMVKRNTVHVMVNMWLAMLMSDYRDVMEKITVPCLLTYGTCQSSKMPKTEEWLQAHINGSEVAAFNGGHIHFLQDPDHFNDVVLNFLAK